MMFGNRFFISVISLAPSAIARCYNPSPAFPVPSWTDQSVSELQSVFPEIESRVNEIVKEQKYENVSFSIEVTTSTETIWQHFHTAPNFNHSRPGTRHVDSSSQYRIASISKLFTTLGILYEHAAGNLHLDDAVLDYLPELSGELPWKDISLRSLASQSSGIPRDSFQDDIINWTEEPWKNGLPPVSREGLPKCHEYNNYVPCTAPDFIGFMSKKHPIFAPNQATTYSNNAFVLLGLVLEKVTGLPYEDYISQSIFQPLNMSMSTLSTPPDTHAVLPADGHSWDIDQSIANPTGGIYSTSSDLSKFLRYILTHYNALATGLNWLKPTSWTFGVNSFYGLPFEIFRTSRILEHGNDRPVTFSTKSGGLEGYLSHVLILEEYGLGITILVGSSATDVFPRILEEVSVGVVRGAEGAVWRGMEGRYSGRWIADEKEGGLNSSIRIGVEPGKGRVVVEGFVSNGTDALGTFAAVETVLGDKKGAPPKGEVQIFPTLLFKDEENKRGEVWRAVHVPDEREPERVWDDYCVADIDTQLYAGLPINELVYWHEEEMVELTAFRIKLKLDKSSSPVADYSGFEGLRVQDNYH